LLRRFVKESAKKKYLVREDIHFKKSFWQNGIAGKKELVEEKLSIPKQ